MHSRIFEKHVIEIPKMIIIITVDSQNSDSSNSDTYQNNCTFFGLTETVSIWIREGFRKKSSKYLNSVNIPE